VRRTLFAIAVVSVAAFAGGAAPASAKTHTKSFKYPVTMDPYEVRQSINIVDRPNVDGFITAMSVNVVNANNTPVPIRRLMLHHIVFATVATRPNTACPTFTGFDNRALPYGSNTEIFYGNGEERNVLALPKGYGYQIYKTAPQYSKWGMVWMFMNHRGVTDHAFIRYTVTWDDAKDLTPVHPYWLDVRNCHADPVYDVPGGGKKGSTYKQTYDYTMPESGRVVAGGGHVHGGAKNLTVTEPDCSNRTVLKSKPAWGMPDHPFYNVRPILHEPGPISMSGMLTQKGYPIAKGQRLRLYSNYDGERPHTRVMGISMVYVAPDESVKGCQKPPDDIIKVQPAKLRGEQFRTKPPKFTVPLTGIDKNGNAVEIKRPPGKTVAANSGDTINVGSYFFGPPNVSVPQGSTLNWKFLKDTLHNVTLANGPRGFSSPNLNDGRGFKFKFKKAGTYRIFCALHPTRMSETVTVK
jgi:plastocyanin